MSKRPFNVTKESYNISTEYNKVDWPNFFLGQINTVWRMLTNDSKIAIDNPGLLIGLLLGKVSDVVKVWTNITNPVSVVKGIIDEVRGKGGYRTLSPHDLTLNNALNMYKILFTDYKKVNLDDPDFYKASFEVFKKAVNQLKETLCKKIEYTTASTSQIGDLKLFKPEKARKEMENAIEYYNKKDPKFAKFAEEAALWCEQNIIEYIAKNVKID